MTMVRRISVEAVVRALALVLLLAGLVPATAAAAREAFVRVDQSGYPASSSKRAYVMASAAEAGAPWWLEDEAGTHVASGTLGAAVGSWSPSFPDVYAVDFDSVATPGRYRLAVGGKAPAFSPQFTIASGPSLYVPLLQNSRSFYENERDGPEYIASALRTAPAHLNDEHAMTYATPKTNGNGAFKGDLRSLGKTIDASGGWWDAGDYLKFVETTSYTVSVMEAAVRDFPAQLGAAAPADMTGEARFGVEWLLRMWDEPDATLYYQVGIGEGNAKTVGDHDIWRLPQADDDWDGSDPADRYIRNRPVFRAGPPGALISPNLAGRDAAAFGLCFQLFRSTDEALAERCLSAGEHIFALADTKPKGRLLTAIPWNFYPEREWRDDLELGATELAVALEDAGGSGLPAGLPQTQPSFYLHEGARWAQEYEKKTRGNSETLNLYDVSGLADFELVRAMRAAGTASEGLAISEAQLIAGLRTELEGATAQSARDPFGFGFPWAEADTASHGDGLAAMAAEYDWLTAGSAYAADEVRWLGNVLGANAWGVSMIIGDGTTWPRCPSHQVANLVGSLDGTPPVLAGGVVEGPTNEPSSGFVEGMRPCPAGGGDADARFDGDGALFSDNVESYTSTEPAIDLTASSLLAFGWGAAGAPAPLG